jgi:plastocyanin
MSPRPLFATAAAVGLLTLAACGSSSNSSTSTGSGGGAAAPASSSSSAPSGGGGAAKASAPAGTSAAGALKVSADASGALKFAPAALKAKAGKVTISFTNPSSAGISHGLSLEGNGVDKEGKIVGGGQSTTLTVNLKPGTYTYYCPVPGHRQAGMVGRITVG